MMPPEIATATGASTKNLAPKHGLEALDLREKHIWNMSKQD